jgi:phosphodiesterase/alkaline phosphatase D-like protein
VTDTTASLSGLVNPEHAATTYKFEYGTSEAYGHSTSPESNLGFSDETDHPAGPTAISGLAAGVEYHFRLVAKNFVATTNGPDRTFVTQGPPEIDTTTSSALTQTTATLGAQINPGGAPTTYHFEYGTSEAYGQSTAESPSLGEDHVAHPAAANIGGLAPGTTYHFRVVAANKYRTEDGPDQTFTTEKAPPVVVPSNQFTASLKAKGARATLKLILPGAGAVSTSGKNLKRAQASPTAAGSLTLTVKLTAAGAKALKQHHKLKLKVSITFQPTGGLPNTVTENVTLVLKPEHRKH